LPVGFSRRLSSRDLAKGPHSSSLPSLTLCPIPMVHFFCYVTNLYSFFLLCSFNHGMQYIYWLFTAISKPIHTKQAFRIIWIVHKILFYILFTLGAGGSRFLPWNGKMWTLYSILL
jgi:hypothetical protein